MWVLIHVRKSTSVEHVCETLRVVVEKAHNLIYIEKEAYVK